VKKNDNISKLMTKQIIINITARSSRRNWDLAGMIMGRGVMIRLLGGG